MLCAWLLPVLFFSFFAGAFSFESEALNAPETVDCNAVILYHNDSMTTLYEDNADAELPAGVTMRLLAALVFAERYEGRMEKYAAVDRRVQGLASSELVLEDGRTARLKRDERVRVYDLLCAMLIANSNDAAYALAFDLFEGADTAVADTVAAMNEKAAALGAVGTHCTDLLGLAPAEGGSYGTTTARDALKIALAVQKDHTLNGICETARYVMSETNATGARLLLTRNYLLSAERRAGFTYKNARGLCAEESAAFGSYGLFTAQSEGRAYTCVVLGGTEAMNAFRIAKVVFEWGIGNFSYKKVLDKIEVLGEVKVELSDDYDYVTVSPAQAISVFLPNDVDVGKEITRKILCESSVRAPVNEGDEVGSITLYYKGAEIGSSKLVTIASLPLSNSGYYFSLFLNFITSPIFLIAAICLFVFFLTYIFINARVRYLRRMRPAVLHTGDEEENPEGARISESAVYEALTDGSAGEAGAREGEQTDSPMRIEAHASDKSGKAKKEKKKKRLKEKKIRTREEKPQKQEPQAPEVPPEPEQEAEQTEQTVSAEATPKRVFDIDAAETAAAAEVPEAPAAPEEAPPKAPDKEPEESGGQPEMTPIEQIAAAQEAKEEEARRAREEEELRRIEEEKKSNRRAFYDLEKDEMTAVDETESEEKKDNVYEPEGWGKYRPGGG